MHLNNGYNLKRVVTLSFSETHVSVRPPTHLVLRMELTNYLNNHSRIYVNCSALPYKSSLVAINQNIPILRLLIVSWVVLVL